MGGRVRDVVDRVFREWLTVPDDQPTRAPLAAPVDATGDVWTVGFGLLAPEEVDLFAEGTVVEADAELALVTDVDYDTGRVTVARGMSGTEPAAHAAGTLVFAAPAYSRRAVVDAVCDNVVALYPQLWRTVTAPVTSGAGPVPVPPDVVTVTGFSYESPGGRWGAGDVQLLVPYAGSASGRAVVFPGVPAGTAGTLSYRAKFTRPTSEDDRLGEFGVEPEWERIVAVGAAAQVLGGRELDTTTQEFLAEQFRAQGFPVGSAGRQRTELLRLHALLLDRAADALNAQYAPVVTVAGGFGSW